MDLLPGTLGNEFSGQLAEVLQSLTSPGQFSVLSTLALGYFPQ